ncbi:MAG TPA: hypothetical protein PLU22_03190 [Polyangiaceae bacterium]|nr:hypothetical protein [Polyangiaceae bacterium]
MQAFKAHVRGGRLVLDEPTDLPEGEVVELVPVDDVNANEEERVGLDASLELSMGQARAGHFVDADQVIRKLVASG